MHVQLQFTEGGEYASPIKDWLDEQFPHVHAKVDAGPGLVVTLELPPEHWDALGSWKSRLMEPCAGLDLALEIIEQCLTGVGVPPGVLLSVHVTQKE